MEKRKLLFSFVLAALGLLLIISAFTAATYAWFTFDPYTLVTPMEGKIADGGSDLLISEKKEGPFERSCRLQPAVMPSTLVPVSTSDLSRFYTATGQDREGYSIAFKDVSSKLSSYLIQGTIYLKSTGGCDVFFKSPALDFGTDTQILSAGRLGIKITGAGGENPIYIFRLDAMGSVSGAQERKTVHADNSVVSGLRGSEPSFSRDPSVSIGDYLIDREGAKKLCTIASGEVVTVDYWLYLEGCDTACYNPVQKRDVVLQLGFAAPQ